MVTKFEKRATQHILWRIRDERRSQLEQELHGGASDQARRKKAASQLKVEEEVAELDKLSLKIHREEKKIAKLKGQWLQLASEAVEKGTGEVIPVDSYSGMYILTSMEAMLREQAEADFQSSEQGKIYRELEKLVEDACRNVILSGDRQALSTIVRQVEEAAGLASCQRTQRRWRLEDLAGGRHSPEEEAAQPAAKAASSNGKHNGKH